MTSALESLRPGERWHLIGKPINPIYVWPNETEPTQDQIAEKIAEDKCVLVWLEDTPPPTQAILDAEVLRLSDLKTATQYQRQRAAEYPLNSDLIVALWEREVEGRPESADALEVLRQDVKVKYPKPV